MTTPGEAHFKFEWADEEGRSGTAEYDRAVEALHSFVAAVAGDNGMCYGKLEVFRDDT